MGSSVSMGIMGIDSSQLQQLPTLATAQSQDLTQPQGVWQSIALFVARSFNSNWTLNRMMIEKEDASNQVIKQNDPLNEGLKLWRGNSFTNYFVKQLFAIRQSRVTLLFQEDQRWLFHLTVWPPCPWKAYHAAFYKLRVQHCKLPKRRWPTLHLQQLW